MYLRWRHRWRKTHERTPEADVHWAAILFENARVNGKWKQRQIVYLAGFAESAAKIMGQRCLIWDRVDDRLDRLGSKITTDDRAKIEAAFAQRVPRPSAADKDSAEGPHAVHDATPFHAALDDRRNEQCLFRCSRQQRSRARICVLRTGARPAISRQPVDA